MLREVVLSGTDSNGSSSKGRDGCSYQWAVHTPKVLHPGFTFIPLQGPRLSKVCARKKVCLSLSLSQTMCAHNFWKLDQLCCKQIGVLFVWGKWEVFEPHLYRNVIKFAIALSFRNYHGPVPTSSNHTAIFFFFTIQGEWGAFSRRGCRARSRLRNANNMWRTQILESPCLTLFIQWNLLLHWKFNKLLDVFLSGWNPRWNDAFITLRFWPEVGKMACFNKTDSTQYSSSSQTNVCLLPWYPSQRYASCSRSFINDQLLRQTQYLIYNELDIYIFTIGLPTPPLSSECIPFLQTKQLQ